MKKKRESYERGAATATAVAAADDKIHTASDVTKKSLSKSFSKTNFF